MRKSGLPASRQGVVQAKVEFRTVVGYFARGYTPNKEIAEAGAAKRCSYPCFS